MLPGSACSASTLQCLFQQGGRVLEGLVILLVSIAVLAFLFNIIRYFIIESDSEAGREKARRYIVWSILGLVIILSIWGIYGILTTILGVGNTTLPPCNDYQQSSTIGPLPNCIPSSNTIP